MAAIGKRCESKYNMYIGKVGQHLVCADLLLKGYKAFIADEGLSYDVLLDIDSSLKKIQVKTTQGLISTKKQKNIYRFYLKMGKNTKQKYIKNSFDILAVVCLDINKIGYVKSDDLLDESGNKYKSLIEFKDKDKNKQLYKTKYIQDFTIEKILGGK